MAEPFGWLWGIRYNQLEQQGRISSNTSSTNTYYYTANIQNQPTTTEAAATTTTSRLTQSTIKALVSSLSTLIVSSGGAPVKPISLDAIKIHLARNYNVDNPEDAESIMEAFKQAYPHVKIATLEEAIQALDRDYTIINSIVRDLLNNELAGGNTYSTDELAKIIKQKYHPAANEAIVNGVFDKLAAQITKVASITKGIHDNPVTYWQNRKYHNPIDTFDRNSFLYRPKLFGSQ